MSISDIIIFPAISVYFIARISMLSYAIHILSADRISITRGIQSMSNAKIQERLMIMICVYQSRTSRSISSVSHEMLNDLKSQLYILSNGIIVVLILHIFVIMQGDLWEKILLIIHDSIKTQNLQSIPSIQNSQIILYSTSSFLLPLIFR